MSYSNKYLYQYQSRYNSISNSKYLNNTLVNVKRDMIVFSGTYMSYNIQLNLELKAPQ